MKLLQQLLEVASKVEAFEVQQQLVDLLPDDYDVKVQGEDLGPSMSYSITITKGTKQAYVKWGGLGNRRGFMQKPFNVTFSMEGVEESTCLSVKVVARVVSTEFEDE